MTDTVYVYFPKPIEDFFNRLISEEGYVNTAEIIREGLNLLIAKTEMGQSKPKKLKKVNTNPSPEAIKKFQEAVLNHRTKHGTRRVCPRCHHTLPTDNDNCLFCGTHTPAPETAIAGG